MEINKLKKKGGERNMAFCKNCGIQLKDGELFCQTCGKKVEEGSTPNVNEQEPKSNDFVGNEMKSGSDKVLLLDKNKGVWKKLIGNKKIVKGLVSIAVVAVALLAGILIIKNMSKKVALDQCIKVETSGYDTQGCAVISLDEEALLESIADAKGEKLKKEGSKSREKQMEDLMKSKN